MSSKIISFAIVAHGKVNHLYDGKPYSIHLSMVAATAWKYIDCIPDTCQDLVLNACWLHDVIEDCRLTYNDVLKVAGKDVAEIVYAVTNEKGKNRKERANEKYYKGIRDTAWASFVKICDRIANVQYSIDNNSTMMEVYMKENDSFIQSLFPGGFMKSHYKELITDLNSLLNSLLNSVKVGL